MRDCLVNCSVDCIASFDNSTLSSHSKGVIYGKGIINGLVCALMDNGLTYLEALTYVKSNIPKESSIHGKFNIDCVPSAWLDDWNSLC